MLLALAYATCSILSDASYGLGMKNGETRFFQFATLTFPLLRSHRSGTAYHAIATEDIRQIQAIEWAVAHDSNAADLWYGLARMQLKAGNKAGYIAALTQLKRLTPGLEYRVVEIH